MSFFSRNSQINLNKEVYLKKNNFLHLKYKMKELETCVPTAGPDKVECNVVAQVRDNDVKQV